MRVALQLLLLIVSAAALLSCGGAEARGDGPTCESGFELATINRDRSDPEGGCELRAYSTGVMVLLPSHSADRGWVVSGTVGDESFTCTYVPGMVEGDSCSDNPRVRWSPLGVRLRAHPCSLSLQLEVDGEHVASASFEPDYEWSEPNGVGCGWAGVAEVVLSLGGA